MTQMTIRKSELIKPVIEKQKLCWVSVPYEKVGNAYGYAVHNKMMHEYGRKYFDYNNDAKIALQIINADNFVYVKDKVNTLFTMWEFLDLPDSYRRGLYQADAIITPCHFCRDLFVKNTTRPVYVCPEGVDDKMFQYHQRHYTPKRDKFRFLWVGAPNPRKGFPIMLWAEQIFEKFPNIELYLKTTVPKMNWKQTFKSCRKNWKTIIWDKDKRLSLKRMIGRISKPDMSDKVQYLGKHKNIIMDTRRLTIEELRDLYNSAHCFVMPSVGEGWGLTLIEAMATGCPCIAPMHTGIAEYFDRSNGYPINYDIAEFDLTNYKLRTRGYQPNKEHTMDLMIEVIQNYDAALRKGRRASEDVRTRFTWDKSAYKLSCIMQDIEKKFV